VRLSQHAARNRDVWNAKRGARPVGLDVSEKQRETARAFQQEHGIEFPLVHASAEDSPFEEEPFDTRGRRARWRVALRPLRGLGGIEALQDIYAPDGPPDDVRYYARRRWATQWPCEEVWAARRRNAE
jgi:Methyltransferase domain